MNPAQDEDLDYRTESGEKRRYRRWAFAGLVLVALTPLVRPVCGVFFRSALTCDSPKNCVADCVVANNVASCRTAGKALVEPLLSRVKLGHEAIGSDDNWLDEEKIGSEGCGAYEDPVSCEVLLLMQASGATFDGVFAPPTTMTFAAASQVVKVACEGGDATACAVATLSSKRGVAGENGK